MTYAALRHSNIYEVNTRQFSKEGSFNEVTRHLLRLRDGGTDILWFMPIYPIGEKNRKGTLGSYYSIRDFKGINPEFGSVEDFAILVNTAHALGMKVIIDWVANHAAWDNVWTLTNPEFFVCNDEGNFMPPYDWDDVIQIDHSNEAQQQEMINSMMHWLLVFNIDGFRADLAHLTPLPFWHKAKSALEKIKPGLIWLAETEDPKYHEVFQVSYAWEWMHACEVFFKGERDMNYLYSVLENNIEKFPPDALRLFFTTNHDENSWNGTEFEKFGNYVKALTVFNFTFPGVPLVYSGQEAENKKRLKFFDKDEIDWPETQNEFSILYQKLNLLRHESAAIGGTLSIIPRWKEYSILAYKLEKDEEQLIVLLNLGKTNVIMDYPGGEGELFYNSLNNSTMKEVNNIIEIHLPAAGYIIMQKNNPAILPG
ncbi:MAG: alpha-amylase family glycosyl hydrolase [Ferruginibacter sp.]